MGEESAAWIGLLGVGIGAVVSLVASVIVPWIRDVLDRKRREREEARRELRTALLGAQAALLDYRVNGGGTSLRTARAPEAQARFGAQVNEVTVRLTPDEQPVLDVLYGMFAMVQQPRKESPEATAQAMHVLNPWFRGDVPTSGLIEEVERRAGVKFSEDRRSLELVDRD